MLNALLLLLLPGLRALVHTLVEYLRVPQLELWRLAVLDGVGDHGLLELVLRL